MKERTEALRVADALESTGRALGDVPNSARQIAIRELRRLHARVEELEAMLDALGAGGVSAQRVTQAKDHITQPTQMATTTVVLPEPIGTVGAAPGTSGFTLTVFEAARVPVGTNIYTEQQVRELLATGSQPQADGRAAERLDALYKALEVCAAELFAQCAHQGRAMKYVEQARKALAAEQCARAAIAAEKEHK